jgi:hypothetical protein
MSRRAAARGLGLPLLVLGLGIGAASPATAASPAVAGRPVAAVVRAADAVPGGLSVALVGAVEDSTYPDVGLVLSVVDAVNGRPEPALTAGNLTPDAAVADLTVTADSAPLPGAYVLVLDTSGSMANRTADKRTTYLERAKALALAFISQLGPNDQVNLIKFSGSASSLGWRAGTDAALTDAIAATKKASGTTHVSAALIAASAAANPVPAGISRRAVVVITDASSADKDANLTPDQMRSRLGPPTFIVGLTAVMPGSAEAVNLQNVAAITGGSFAQVDASTDPAALFKPVLDSAHSVWKVRFHTDATPDGKTHQETIGISDAEQRTGRVTFSYLAGGLRTVSQIAIDGLAPDAVVTSDITLTVTVKGSRSWAHTQLALYIDCDPAECDPASSAVDGALAWPLAVGPLAQGRHMVVARLTVTDDQGKRFGPEELSLSFTRSGTTWNVAAVALVGGIALVAIGAVFIASRRKSSMTTRRSDR